MSGNNADSASIACPWRIAGCGVAQIVQFSRQFAACPDSSAGCPPTHPASRHFSLVLQDRIPYKSSGRDRGRSTSRRPSRRLSAPGEIGRSRSMIHRSSSTSSTTPRRNTTLPESIPKWFRNFSASCSNTMPKWLPARSSVKNSIAGAGDPPGRPHRRMSHGRARTIP